MKTLTVASLAGGQGKTTTAFLLGKLLSGTHKVLMVDADPQANLTFYLGHDVESNAPTLLELLKNTVAPLDSVYSLEQSSNMFLIPADDGLSAAVDFLSSSGMGALVLKNRLKPLSKLFDYCIVDSAPGRNQITMTAIGAADALIIPAESSTKGVGSLLRTLELVNSLDELGAFSGSIEGVIPFRDRWFGRSRSKDSASAIDAMKEIVDGIEILPSIVESERFKQALNTGVTLAEMGYASLQRPFESLRDRL